MVYMCILNKYATYMTNGKAQNITQLVRSVFAGTASLFCFGCGNPSGPATCEQPSCLRQQAYPPKIQDAVLHDRLRFTLGWQTCSFKSWPGDFHQIQSTYSLWCYIHLRWFIWWEKWVLLRVGVGMRNNNLVSTAKLYNQDHILQMEPI